MDCGERWPGGAWELGGLESTLGGQELMLPNSNSNSNKINNINNNHHDNSYANTFSDEEGKGLREN